MLKVIQNIIVLVNVFYRVIETLLLYCTDIRTKLAPNPSNETLRCNMVKNKKNITKFVCRFFNVDIYMSKFEDSDFFISLQKENAF